MNLSTITKLCTHRSLTLYLNFRKVFSLELFSAKTVQTPEITEIIFFDLLSSRENFEE
jgi:hypothetical protein